jgi:hypothetical protein
MAAVFLPDTSFRGAPNSKLWSINRLQNTRLPRSEKEVHASWKAALMVVGFQYVGMEATSPSGSHLFDFLSLICGIRLAKL